MLLSALPLIVPLLGSAFCVNAAPTTTTNSLSSCIKWSACPNNPSQAVQCAQFSVPLDYSEPFRATTTLSLVRVKSNSTTPKGSVFLNPGGPGQPWEDVLEIIFSHGSPLNDLLGGYHLVGVDPRGVGQSSPIKCDPKLWNRRVPIMVQNEAEFTAMVQHYKAFGESCKKMTGSVLDHMDTVHVVKDFDQVRQAIGADKFNFIGLSYGTQIGYTYAEMFPNTVGRMVLDGVLDHTQSSVYSIQTESTTFEATLRQFFKWCQEASTCALHGQGDVERFFKNLVITAQADPLPAPSCNQTGALACKPNVSYEELLRNVRPDLASPDQWAKLATKLLAASKGNASALSGGYYTNETYKEAEADWAYLGVACQDWNRAQSFADLQAVERMRESLSPIARGYSGMFSSFAKCIAWPAKVTNAQRPLKPSIATTPKMMLVNAFWDSATSVQWAVSMREQIPNAHLVFRNGSGHTSYFLPGDTARAINGFLLDGKLPADGTVYQS